jgi:hypothetical protein
VEPVYKYNTTAPKSQVSELFPPIYVKVFLVTMRYVILAQCNTFERFLLGHLYVHKPDSRTFAVLALAINTRLDLLGISHVSSRSTVERQNR